MTILVMGTWDEEDNRELAWIGLLLSFLCFVGGIFRLDDGQHYEESFLVQPGWRLERDGGRNAAAQRFGAAWLLQTGSY